MTIHANMFVGNPVGIHMGAPTTKTRNDAKMIPAKGNIMNLENPLLIIVVGANAGYPVRNAAYPISIGT